MKNDKGFIYIIGHASFGENTYKLGFTQTSKTLMQRYRTYYPVDPTIIEVYPVTEARLAERLLFHWLKENRVHPRKEFFKENVHRIKDLCLRVQSVVDLTHEFLGD